MGIFGAYGVKKASAIIYYGLHALQHRGQEGAGIVTFEGEQGYRHRSDWSMKCSIPESSTASRARWASAA